MRSDTVSRCDTCGLIIKLGAICDHPRSPATRAEHAALLARVEALEAAQPLSDAAARKWSEDSKEHARTMADRDAWKARAKSAEEMVVKLEVERDAAKGAAAEWERIRGEAYALYRQAGEHRDRLAAEVQRRRIEFDEFAAKAEAERDRMRDALMSVAAEELKAGKWAMGCACSDRLPYIYSVVRKALAALEAK